MGAFSAMDYSTTIASAASLFKFDSPSLLLRPRRTWTQADPFQNWTYHEGQIYNCKATCKTNTGWMPCLLRSSLEASKTQDTCSLQSFKLDFQRRAILPLPAALLFVSLLYDSLKEETAVATEFTDMPALRGKDYGKTKMRYPDFRETDSGLQYKDLRLGTGSTPKEGETVVVDWDGYTIGYYGRIFEARNKAKGGSFEGNEKSYFRFKLGSHEVIPAFEEAISTMKMGGVRRIIVPPELGYPDNDFNKKGPRPTTFSGQRALDFVLRNQGLIDKTLLFDIELLKISPV